MSRYHLLYANNAVSEKVLNNPKVTIKYTSLLKGMNLCKNYTSPNASPVNRREDFKRITRTGSKENKFCLKIRKSQECREGFSKPLQERSRSTLNSQKLLELKEKNSELKRKLNELHEEEAERVFKETKNMRESLQEREGNRVALTAKYEKLKSDIQKLPEVPSESTIKRYYEDNRNLKRRIETLHQELKTVMNTHISKQELNDIQEEVRLADKNQSELIEINRNLKIQIEDEHSLPHDETPVQIRSYSRECAFLLKELDILQRLATSIFTGEQMDLSFILGSNPIGDMEGKSLHEIVGYLRKEMNNIMSLVIS